MTTGGTLDKWRYSRQLGVLSITGGTLDNWRYFGRLEVLWTTGGALDNWRCSGQLEILWTTGGAFNRTGSTLDNWRCSRQLEILWTTGGARQLEVLWTSGGALDSWGYFGQVGVLSTTVGPPDNWRCSRQLEIPRCLAKNCGAKTNFPSLFEVACITQNMNAGKQGYFQTANGRVKWWNGPADRRLSSNRLTAFSPHMVEFIVSAF